MWLKAVGFGRFDQTIESSAGSSPSGRAGEEPVLPAYDEGPDGIFSHVVVRCQVRTLEIEVTLPQKTTRQDGVLGTVT